MFILFPGSSLFCGSWHANLCQPELDLRWSSTWAELQCGPTCSVLLNTDELNENTWRESKQSRTSGLAHSTKHSVKFKKWLLDSRGCCDQVSKGDFTRVAQIASQRRVERGMNVLVWTQLRHKLCVTIQLQPYQLMETNRASIGREGLRLLLVISRFCGAAPARLDRLARTDT